MPELRFGGQGTTVIGEDSREIALTLGWAALVERELREGVRPVALENAIAAIEDELMRLRPAAIASSLTSSDGALRDIALAAGLASLPATLERAAIEQLFERLAANALGRPDPLLAQFQDKGFAARLTLLREVMHHLDIRAVAVADGG